MHITKPQVGGGTKSAWLGDSWSSDNYWQTTNFNVFIRGGSREYGYLAGLFAQATFVGTVGGQNISFRPTIVVY